MAIELQVPKLGLTMEEAELVSWKFSAGEAVRKDQIVLVLETDKISFEMPSPGDGLLLPVIASGSRIAVGEVLGYLASDRVELEKLSVMHPAAENGVPAVAAEVVDFAAAASKKGLTAGGAAAGARIKASPVARVMAGAHGINLGAVSGSGPGGRIVRADIVKALERGVTPAAPAEDSKAPAGPELLSAAQEIPIAGVRRAIFKNMHLSISSQAQLTLHTEASAEGLVRVRGRLNAAGGAKISYNAILVKAAACALKQHPGINASVDKEVIKVWRQIHVGVAMDMGRGLIVPKIRNADAKSVREISAELDRLVEAAESGSLSLDELSLGTFTLTNLGAWDIDAFTPIVNHPESAILGVGRIEERPVAREGQVAVERRMALSLSFDHRIIDGAPGAAFLKTIKDMIEEPAMML